jgi:hypothetical protein
MENVQKFTLIDGVFSPSDARELLLTLYNDKIRYHNRQLLAKKEKATGYADEEKKIAHLTDLRDSVMTFLGVDDPSVTINGVITITKNTSSVC